MRISTIIPAFNCEPYLDRAISSLLATNDPDLEIVIVDDGSKDGTRAKADEWRDRHPDRIVVLTHPGAANRGVSLTRNRGIAGCTGDLIAFLDADDYVHPWRFESARQILSQRAEVDAVYQTCEMAYSDEAARQEWWDSRPLFGLTEPLEGAQLLCSLLNTQTWHTSAIVLRRQLLDRTGDFEPTLRIAEDCHLWLRMAHAGRVVAGDLSRPVACYFRHRGSAYEATPCQRLHAIRALVTFYHWTRRNAPRDPHRPLIHKSISDYILRGLEAARKANDRRLAWSIAIRSAIWFPALGMERRWYGNVARLTFG